MIRTAVISLLLFAVIVAAVGLASESAPAASQAPPEKGRLSQLLQARYEAARRLLEIEQARLADGRATLFTVCETARRVRDSALDLDATPETRRAALARYLDIARQLEESVNKVVESGRAPISDKELALYLRLDAEIALLRAR